MRATSLREKSRLRRLRLRAIESDVDCVDEGGDQEPKQADGGGGKSESKERGDRIKLNDRDPNASEQQKKQDAPSDRPQQRREKEGGVRVEGELKQKKGGGDNPEKEQGNVHKKQNVASGPQEEETKTKQQQQQQQQGGDRAKAEEQRKKSGGGGDANKQQQQKNASVAPVAAKDKKQQNDLPKPGGGAGNSANSKQQQPSSRRGAAFAAAEKKQQEDIPAWWVTSKRRFKTVQTASRGGKGDLQQQQGWGGRSDPKQQQVDALRLSPESTKVGDSAQQPGGRLSRQVFIVCLICAGFAAAMTFLVRPASMDPFLRGFTILLSLARRLITGTKSSEYAVEAVVCTALLLVLRFALQPFARRVFFWWTDSTSDKAWTSSALYWVILNVYGPLELALVTVAGMRFVEAGIERYKLIQPKLLNAVVERLVVIALVGAFSRVALSWQERYFSQKTFDLELEGKPLQAERLAGLNKLSNIATYLVAIALGLKMLGVDIGALVTFGGISGLAIGLAGRQILENAFMGLMLYATAPFMPGDEIKFSTSQEKDIEGMVLDIGLFRTTIKSFQREEYIVPNALFSSLVLLNVTRKAKEWRVRTDINVRLADAPRVANMLTNYRSLLKSDDRVLRSLHRRVFLERVTPEGLVIHISFYVEAVNKDQFFAIQQDLLQKFLETCKNNSVRIATPIRGVMAIQSDDGLDGPLMSKEAAAALGDDGGGGGEDRDKSEGDGLLARETSGLAAALSSMSGGLLGGGGGGGGTSSSSSSSSSGVR